MAARNNAAYLLTALLVGIVLLLLGYAGAQLAFPYPIVLECIRDDDQVREQITIEREGLRNFTLSGRRGIVESFIVTEIDETIIKAEGEVLSYVLDDLISEKKSIEIDRVSGRLVRKALLDPLVTPILASRCAGDLSVDFGLSLEECKKKVANIDKGAVYLCDIYAEEPYAQIVDERLCSSWMFGHDIHYVENWRCNKAEAKF